MDDLPSDVLVGGVAGADRGPRYARAVHKRVRDLGLQDRIEIRSVAKPGPDAGFVPIGDACGVPSTCENAGSFALYDGLHFGVPTLASDRSSMRNGWRSCERAVNRMMPAGCSAMRSGTRYDDAARDRLSHQEREPGPTTRPRGRGGPSGLSNFSPPFEGAGAMRMVQGRRRTASWVSERDWFDGASRRAFADRGVSVLLCITLRRGRSRALQRFVVKHRDMMINYNDAVQHIRSDDPPGLH